MWTGSQFSRHHHSARPATDGRELSGVEVAVHAPRLLVVFVKLPRIDDSQFHVPARSANIGFDLSVQPVLEDQGFWVAKDDSLQFPVRRMKHHVGDDPCRTAKRAIARRFFVVSLGDCLRLRGLVVCFRLHDFAGFKRCHNSLALVVNFR